MSFNWIQHSFISGELSPAALARNDMPAFSSGLKKAKNVMILPQGSISKRWGSLKYDDTPFKNIPHFHDFFANHIQILNFDFNDNNTYVILLKGISTALLPSKLHLYIIIYKNDQHFQTLFIRDVNLPKDSLNKFYSAQFGDSLIVCHPTIPPLRIVRQLNQSHNSSQESFYAYFVSFVSQPLDDNNNPIWNDKNGYPQICCFHENRLLLAASTMFPQTIWGSKTGLFFDFKPLNNARDDDAIEISLQSNRLNRIHSLHSSKNLLVFTTGGLWTQSVPLTPKNSSQFKIFSEYASSDILPAFSEDGFIFKERFSSSLRLVQSDWQFDTFKSSSLDYLAGHILKNPRQILVWRGAGNLAVNYIIAVNDDGSLAVIGLDVDHNILNWVTWTFRVPCISCQVTNGELIICCKDDRNRFFVGRLSPDCIFDFQENNIIKAPSSVWVPYLSEEENDCISTIREFGKKALLGDYFISLAGQFFGKHSTRLPYSPTDSIFFHLLKKFHNYPYQIGFCIDLEIETLPINVPSPKGSSRYDLKRNCSISLDLKDSHGWKLQYQNQSYEPPPFAHDFDWNKPIPAYTGIHKVNLLHYGYDSSIKITQKTPFNFKLLAINTQFTS